MKIKIGSNIGSLLAQRKLGENRDAASVAQERLSTGMRINRAADDAAGLHIASKLNSDVRTYNQALRNINDGISVFNVMEQAVSALQTITTRQRELAEQSANGILTSQQRLLVHKEARALSLEYERIIQTTEFNGRKLFDDDNRDFSIQAGIGENEILEFEFAKHLTKTVGDGTFEELYTYNIGRNPNSILTADFNNDGIDDIAVSNQRDNNIGVLLGNADGSFQNEITSGTGSRPNSLQVGDFNNDGILDLANNDFGNSGLGETVSIVFGNGDGTFGGRVTIETGVGPTALAVGDVDNDGNLDITAATASANFLSGLPERFRVTTPTNGTTESTEVTFTNAPEREVTSINAIEADNSIAEVSTITTDAASVQEISTITAVDADTSVQEVSSIVADAIATQEEVDITVESGGNMTSGDYFLIDSPDGNFYVWYNIDGAGADPTVGGRTGIEVAITSVDSDSTVASATQTAINARAEFSASVLGNTVSVTNVSGGSVADAQDGTIGGAFNVNVTTQGTNSDISNGSYFTIDSPDTAYYIWFDINNSGSDPSVGGRTGIEVDVNWGDSANTVASAIQSAIDGQADFSASVLSDTVTVTNANGGASTNITSGTVSTSTFSVATSVNGIDSDIESGDHFFISSPDTDYYVWFNVDGAGSDPSVGGRTAIEVALNSSDNANTVASKIETAIDALGDFGANAIGDTITVTNTNGGSATNISDQTVGGSFSVATTQSGADSDIENGDYFTLDTPNNSYYVWFDYNNTGSDPSVGGRTGIEVDLNYGDSQGVVASKLQVALNAVGDLSAGVGGSTVTVTNDDTGAVANITNGTITGGTFSTAVSIQGTDSDLQSGDYFFLSSPSTNYYVWYNVDGAGSDPGIGGRTGIEVAVNSSDNANSVASKTSTAIGALSDFNSGSVGSTITVTNSVGGIATNGTDQTVGGSFSIGTTNEGVDSIFENGDYFIVDSPGTDYYVWFNYGGASDPSVGGKTGIEITANYDDSASTLASLVSTALGARPEFNTSVASDVLTINNVDLGTEGVATGTVTGLSINVTQTGTYPGINSGDYFTFSSLTTDYYAWYNVDGGGGDPGLGGRTGIQINISDGDTGDSIATATGAAINARPELSVSVGGSNVTVAETTNGEVTNAANGNVSGLNVNILQEGTETRVNIATDSITAPGHGFQTGLQVSLLNGGTLPGGLSQGPIYYIIAVDSDTIAFATSEANALSDTRINLTSFGVGIHSIVAEGATSGGGFSFGNGDGTFGDISSFNAGQLPSAFALADFNFDGNLDLAVAEQLNDNIEILIGDGTGVFTNTNQYSVGNNPEVLRITDIDLDGAVDIISADTDSNQISVLKGDNSGTFVTSSYGTVGNEPSDVFAIDLNGDNLKDVVTTDYDSDSGTGGTIFMTDSSGNLTQFGTFTGGVGARKVTGGDFNGDGVNDLAIANDSDETVSILMANTTQSSIAQFYDLTTQGSSRDALDALSEQATRLSQGMAYIGSSQARLEIAKSNIEVKVSEYQSAVNRIQDADIALEAANLIKARIQEQVTAQVLSISNLNLEIVLELLK